MPVPRDPELTGRRILAGRLWARQAPRALTKKVVVAHAGSIFAMLVSWPLTVTASAQGSDRDRTAHIEVDMANFKYVPSTISLHHGQPYVFEFVNKSGIGHNFVARRFFAAATIDAPGRALLTKGEVNLHGRETADIRLIAPPAGTYAVHCSHFMHSVLGMKGQILVD